VLVLVEADCQEVKQVPESKNIKQFFTQSKNELIL
jgi:hypothetical protein